MFKYLAVILPLVAVALTQGPLPNVAVLNNGNFIIRWGVSLIGNVTPIAEIEIQANCTGWLSVSLVSSSGRYADVHWGSYNASTDYGVLKDLHMNMSMPMSMAEEDPTQDLIFQGAVFHEPWSIVRMRRLANTGDALNDVPIVSGPMTVGWAYSNSAEFGAPEAASGYANVTFLP